MSKIKVPATSVPDKGMLPDLYMAIFSCIFIFQRAEGNRLSKVSYKGFNPIHEGSTLMTQLPPKGSNSKYYYIGDLAFNI